MKTIAQTKNYVVVRIPGGQEGAEDFDTAMQGMIESMEMLREEELRPLHYLPRLSAWVCEKVETDEVRLLKSRVTQVEGRMAAMKKNGQAGAS